MMLVDDFLCMTPFRTKLAFGFRTCACRRDNCFYCTDGVCTITYVRCQELDAPVRTVDGRVYDAFALQKWLTHQRQQGSECYVIPGVIISHVERLSVVSYLYSKWVRDASERVDVATQTDDVACALTPPCLSQKVDIGVDAHGVAAMEGILPLQNPHRLLELREIHRDRSPPTTSSARGLECMFPRKVRRCAHEYNAYIDECKFVRLQMRTASDAGCAETRGHIAQRV